MKQPLIKIYKYVTFERWENLESGFIRFTPPSELNDPFEMAPFCAEWMTDEIFEGLNEKAAKEFNINSFADSISSQLWNDVSARRRMGMLDDFASYMELQSDVRRYFSQNPQETRQQYLNNFPSSRFGLDHLVKELPSQTNETFGVLSLTTKYDNRPMWAHYANNHSGLVFEFNAQHPFFNKRDKKSDFSKLRKITYSTERPNLKAFLDSPEKWTNAHFVKSSDWAYEEEYRLVHLLKKSHKVLVTPDGNKIHLFKLPPDCVIGIILGLRMNQANKQTVVDFLKSDPRYSHVTIYEIKQDEKTFDLHKCKVR